MDSYLNRMDGLLTAGCGLFPTGTAEPRAVLHAATADIEVPEPPEGGGLAEATRAAAAEYRSAGKRVTALADAIREATNEAAAEGQRGRAAATVIRATARTRAAAITGVTQTPDGLGLLVSTMDERLAAMQSQIDASRRRLQNAADQIRQHSQELATVFPV